MSGREPIAWLDGELMPLGEARVPVLDRGFLFGDAVYEVIPVYGGRPCRMDEHLDRLSASLDATAIPEPVTSGLIALGSVLLLRRRRG